MTSDSQTTTTDNVTKLPTNEPPPYQIGPVMRHPVHIEGKLIPQLEAWDEGDKTFISVDSRICISVPKKCGYDVCFIVATALAVGKGYACLTAEDKFKPFASNVNFLEKLP